MHTTLDITNDHFCKQRSHIWASIEAHNSLAGRFRLPDKSTMSPALQSLHKDAYFAGYAPSVDLPANTELPSGWIDFWRTESVTVTIGLMYHPFYQIQKSDLPESAIPSQFAAKPSHPFMLEEDTLDITVLIGGSEVFVSGYGLWFAKNFVDNYFGMYNKVSDIDSYKAHTRLSRRMFGDVREAIELYRPLGLKMCIRVQNVRAHCLIHSVQTDGPVPDYCPVIYVEQSVLEVVRNLREMKIQVCTFGGAMFFERSRSFPSATEGFLTVDSLSFRGHALLSEDGISWDAGAIEYAWIVEVIIGNVVGKLHPTQAVMLFQFLETVHVMTNATDEELLVSERYDLCQHLNDIRTCSHSNLRLTDAAFRTQNCESADKLEYKLIRGGIDSVSLCLIEEQYAAELAIAPTRASVCNCHESSFCSSILLGILNVCESISGNLTQLNQFTDVNL
uniref:Bridge-like lipid transfer protein family member 1 N-terminal domain-containing protein n=3 Tax=Parascaris univalens TaxID=6257 RepID=A0A915A4B7_PARUN